MSEIKYLKNVDTGVVFMYSDILFHKSNMVPCDQKGKVNPTLTQAAADQREEERLAKRKGKPIEVIPEPRQPLFDPPAPEPEIPVDKGLRKADLPRKIL